MKEMFKNDCFFELAWRYKKLIKDYTDEKDS